MSKAESGQTFDMEKEADPDEKWMRETLAAIIGWREKHPPPGPVASAWTKGFITGLSLVIGDEEKIAENVNIDREVTAVWDGVKEWK